MRLTDEQKAIVACDLNPGEILKVMAFAGTGKTSTLIEYTIARPGLRFLYVAFNKSVQLEAQKRFPKNVIARTSHALAFRTHGHTYKDRLVSGFRANTAMAALDLNRYEDARFTIITLNNYLISADPKVSGQHIPQQAKAFYSQKGEAMPDFVSLSNRLGRIMCDGSDESIGMLHDGYLKLYQLSHPKLNYDCILLDEAQDINPVTSAFILEQANPNDGRRPASIILVGDSHQQIYSFRGAKNTLYRIKSSRTMYLTRSFRFDNNVARVANMVLGVLKGEKKRVVGRPVNKADKPKWNPRRYTVIARTNAALFDKAVELYKTKKIGFVGGVEKYRLSAIRDTYFLYARKSSQIEDRYIKSFDSYTDLKMYAGAVEDVELFSVCKVVENYGAAIPVLVEKIVENNVDLKEAEVVLTTAHKSKGLEWDNVLLLGDFPVLVDKGEVVDDLEPDEYNLVYVAMTRAKSRLKFDKGNSVPEFIRFVRKLKADRKNG
jgi:F-box protein 18 (helicase)